MRDCNRCYKPCICSECTPGNMSPLIKTANELLACLLNCSQEIKATITSDGFSCLNLTKLEDLEIPEADKKKLIQAEAQFK